MQIADITKKEFVFICNVMNGIHCRLSSFRFTFVEILNDGNGAGTFAAIDDLIAKLEQLSDRQMSHLYDKVYQYWEADYEFTPDQRIAELGLDLEE